jgi:integrase
MESPKLAVTGLLCFVVAVLADDYLATAGKKPGEFLYTSHRAIGRPMTVRQYARFVSEWIASIGLDPRIYSTHSLRRTKVALIYRRSESMSAFRDLRLYAGHCPCSVRRF